MDLNHFEVTKLSAHLYRITDALDVCCYLVAGQDGLRLDGKPGNVLYSEEKVF